MSSDTEDLLNRRIDQENGGVPKHLGQIADAIYEWEGPVAMALGLTTANVAAIVKKYPNQLNMQA